MKCTICKADAVVKLRAHNSAFCRDCFLKFFTNQIQRGIEKENLFTRDDRILVCISGGKDSLSLLYELTQLGYDVTGLFIDLSIPGSSSVARGIVESFCAKHKLALITKVLAEDGLAMPDVKAAVRRPICSVCGKIKRYYFNKIARDNGFTALATGHNLDDEVARLFSNTLRWDKAYLSTEGPLLPAENGFVKKVKPLWRLTEYETATFAFLMGIHPHSAPCPYSTGASFTVLKGIMQRLEHAMPGRKLDFYQNFLKRGREPFAAERRSEGSVLSPCPECGYPTSSGGLCGVCRLRRQVAEWRKEKANV